ncbi:MAG: hypothetical protein V1816_26570 [Pseudomonadota bacterium]
MNKIKIRAAWWGVLLLMLSAPPALTTGCSGTPEFLKPKPASESADQAHRDFFKDILVPEVLDFNKDKSFFFEAGAFRAGTLYFSGYVEINSLREFFSKALPRDGWRLRSIFNGPKMLLLFEKENKVCVIEIYEETVLTRVEIWVAPSV